MKLSYQTKLVISILFDIIDLFMPPGYETILDILSIPLGVALWGWQGLWNVWEVIDIISVDRFVPTMTLTALLSKKKK